MKLYGNPRSTCTRKVLITLAEKGQEAELIVVDLSKREQKSEAHLRRQPFGVVPVLEEDAGFQMYESRAIIRYLDRTLPGTKLTPDEPHAYARMEQWISVEQSYFSHGALAFLYQSRAAQPDPEAIAKARASVTKALDVVEPELRAKPYLAGAEFSLADISWMPYVPLLLNLGHADLVNTREGFAAWWKRVSERPSWKKVLSLVPA